MNESAEITIKELSDMAVGSYLLADVRDEISFGYGAIPGGGQYAEYCWNWPKKELLQRIRNIFYIA